MVRRMNEKEKTDGEENAREEGYGREKERQRRERERERERRVRIRKRRRRRRRRRAVNTEKARRTGYGTRHTPS